VEVGHLTNFARPLSGIWGREVVGKKREMRGKGKGAMEGNGMDGRREGEKERQRRGGIIY